MEGDAKAESGFGGLSGAHSVFLTSPGQESEMENKRSIKV